MQLTDAANDVSSVANTLSESGAENAGGRYDKKAAQNHYRLHLDKTGGI
ncbi:MAG: hypothetical protein KA447_00655 [Pyrinomonadaceae bacterium]|nr:hypothetical protein [Pyrinomonadaceae bacterium]